MKKLIILLLAISPFISCDDSETNDVSFQARINDRLYQATEANASVNDDGKLIIQGSNYDESLTISLSKLKKGKFTINGSSKNHAIYADAFGNVFNTVPNGTGTVNISEVDETNRTISGSFNFSAILPGVDTVFVSRGTIYQVSYSDGNMPIPGEAGILKAKVDGSPFVPSSVSALSTGNSILISGDTSQSSIAISVPVDVSAGEYTLPRSRFSAKYQDSSGPQTTSEGLLEVISHDAGAKTIKGTFSFSTNLSEITEGEFEVTYQ